jgi:D-serine dehydratase
MFIGQGLAPRKVKEHFALRVRVLEEKTQLFIEVACFVTGGG